MRVWLEEPIDRTHRDSVDATRWIRKQANEARKRLGLPVRDYESR